MAAHIVQPYLADWHALCRHDLDCAGRHDFLQRYVERLSVDAHDAHGASSQRCHQWDLDGRVEVVALWGRARMHEVDTVTWDERSYCTDV